MISTYSETSAARALLLLTTASVMLMVAACKEQTNATSGDFLSSYEEGRRLLYEAKTRFDIPQAVTQLEETVALDGAHAGTRLTLAYAYLKLYKFEEAAQHIVVAKELRAQLAEADALWLDALSARVDDDWDAELASWARVVEASPEDRWAWYELAFAQSVVEDYEAAAESAAQALALEPDSTRWEASWIYYLQSKAFYRSGQYRLAIEAAERGRGNETTWRSTFFRLGLGRVRAGEVTDTDPLIEEYRQIAEAEGRTSASGIEANIALFFFELGDYARAIEHARSSFELNPKIYESWALGYSLTENGDVAEGLKVLEQAATENPGDVGILTAQGWALYRAGRLEQARDVLLTARSASSRKRSSLEKRLQLVEEALRDPSAPQAPPLPWLG